MEGKRTLLNKQITLATVKLNFKGMKEQGI